MALEAPFIDPNPESVEWTKTNRVTVHEIPGFKDKTQLTSNEVLWHLHISGTVLTETGRDSLKYIINSVGPFEVVTDFQKLDEMYVANGRVRQVAGSGPLTFSYTLDLTEKYDP
jgi:hypothetical protein